MLYAFAASLASDFAPFNLNLMTSSFSIAIEILRCNTKAFNNQLKDMIWQSYITKKKENNKADYIIDILSHNIANAETNPKPAFVYRSAAMQEISPNLWQQRVALPKPNNIAHSGI